MKKVQNKIVITLILFIFIVLLRVQFNWCHNITSAHSNAGDLAECMPLSPVALKSSMRPVPGEVVEVDTQGLVRKCRAANSPYVVGIVSTNPAHVLRDKIKDSVPIALSCVVLCKVTNEHGMIKPGDLLVSASKPGYAMKASQPFIPGTIIGKALDAQDSEEGIVLVLVMMR